MKAQAVAKLKHLRMSPRKVRLVVGLIRGASVENAIVQLENNTKHATRPVLKLLKSAVANAKENHSLIEDTLVIKTAFVDEAATLHRWMPRAMGRATPLRKRGSHVTIVLEGEVKEEKKKVKKADKVVEVEDKKESSVKKETKVKADTKKKEDKKEVKESKKK
jgi:large subunit ribosomal protein L22